jgi:hypothetical protein
LRFFPFFSLWICSADLRIQDRSWARALISFLLPAKASDSRSSREFWSSYSKPLKKSGPLRLALDRTEYPVIDRIDLPAGYAEVDVTLVVDGTQIPCIIVAGLVGMGFSLAEISLCSPLLRMMPQIQSDRSLRGEFIQNWTKQSRNVVRSLHALGSSILASLLMNHS